LLGLGSIEHKHNSIDIDNSGHTIISKSEIKRVALSTYGDYRLSLGRFQKSIEVKIDILFENIIKFDTTPTEKQLKSLSKDIQTLRAYGKDISRYSKFKLLKAIKKLVNQHYEDIDILKELVNILKTSQNLMA